MPKHYLDDALMRCRFNSYVKWNAWCIFQIMWQGGEVETRLAHNQKIGGANPPPATNYLYARKRKNNA